MTSTREHYERYPYPPVPTFALPLPDQGERLKYPGSPDGIRILVAGAGTLEPLIVAQSHPKAAEIVAVDLSTRSLSKLRMRIWLAKFSLLRHRLPPIRCIAADLTTWHPESSFDYIVASNMLHHVEDPAALLERFSSWLKPGGSLRAVTYPKRSRLWMRETSRWLKSKISNVNELSGKALVQACKSAIAKLPQRDPVRSCFESQPEVTHEAGLADAFFNPCENPLSPLEWETASNRAGLELVAEGQDPTSHSSFLTELLPATSVLTRWERLQILDDSLELCANPIFWFKKVGNIRKERADRRCVPQNTMSPAEEMIAGLKMTDALLKKAGLRVIHLLDALEDEVGPRVSTRGDILPGLSVTEYPFLRAHFAESALDVEEPLAGGVEPAAPPVPELSEGFAAAGAAADDEEEELRL
jgi:SAM-dependent methyltransferase